MRSSKLVITILLALFLVQQYSLASPTQEQDEDANRGSHLTLTHNVTPTQPIRGTISERFFRMNPEFCIGPATDLLRDQLAFLPQISQGITNLVAITYDLLQCAQGGGSFQVTLRCIQNVIQRTQAIINTTLQQEMHLISTSSTGLSTLFRCLTAPPLP